MGEEVFGGNPWDPGFPYDPSQLGGGGSEQHCVSTQVPS